MSKLEDKDQYLDFTRFMKKIHEIENNKKVVFKNPDENELTPQQQYIRKYNERANNCIVFINKDKK